MLARASDGAHVIVAPGNELGVRERRSVPEGADGIVLTGVLQLGAGKLHLQQRQNEFNTFMGRSAASNVQPYTTSTRPRVARADERCRERQF